MPTPSATARRAATITVGSARAAFGAAVGVGDDPDHPLRRLRQLLGDMEDRVSARQLQLPTGCQVILLGTNAPCGAVPACLMEPPYACMDHLRSLLAQGFCSRCGVKN